MQSAILRRVAMWFVASVNDWSFERCFQSNLFFKEIRTLADLKSWLIGTLATQPTVFGTNFSGAAKDLPSHKVCRYLLSDLCKWGLSRNQVILMATITIAFAIRIVFINDDLGMLW